ncbi:hypothetical protein ACFQY7_51425 [Actinomadura luteofluorescens]|uniref:hypothetical protein n=1 Tax=Actinomadura luteofluorescens TaxID=46163 RepID=UPI00363D8C9B
MREVQGAVDHARAHAGGRSPASSSSSSRLIRAAASGGVCENSSHGSSGRPRSNRSARFTVAPAPVTSSVIRASVRASPCEGSRRRSIRSGSPTRPSGRTRSAMISAAPGRLTRAISFTTAPGSATWCSEKRVTTSVNDRSR